MSTNLQETFSLPENWAELVPDLSAHGIDWAESAAAQLTLFGVTFRDSIRLIKSIEPTSSITKTNQKFRRALRLLTPAFVQAEGVPVAIAALVAIAGSPRISPSARVSAANSILEHAKSADMRAPGDGKAPEEMTLDEIQAAIGDLEHEAANRARDITPQKGLDKTHLERDDSYIVDLL